MVRVRTCSFVWLLLLFSALLSSESAFADGKVFPTRAIAVPVKVPDQRAMLHFSNGFERLVIDTSFVGEGTNFAWVVPLPSAPKIETVSTNFFTSLSRAFQPEVVHAVSDAWIFFLILGLVIALLIRVGRTRGLASCLALMALLFLLLTLLLPAFAPAHSKSISATVESVKLIDRRNVGVYDTATLAGQDGRALMDWLNTHGFYTPTSALPVISSYATQGWVFAAATINREAAAPAGSRPHPLAFTFRSEKPVYPLRLTGVENDSCDIELFVFGPERAEVAGFQVEFCGNPFSAKPVPLRDSLVHKELFFPPQPGEYRIGAPEVRDLALPAAVATKLAGTLRPQDMRTDAWIRWVPFKPVFPVLYSHSAAADSSLDWTVGIGVLGVLLIQILAPRLKRQTCHQALLGVAMLAIACGLVRLATLKTTKVQILRGGRWAAINEWRQLDMALQVCILDKKITGPLTFDKLQAALKEEYGRGTVRNTFINEPLRNEATPGNITLQQTTNGTDVLWHDIDGAPHVMATFEHNSN